MNWPDDYINKIIAGDCLKIMKGIPDGAIDCVITDPPYGEKTHNGARTTAIDKKLISFDSITKDRFLYACAELVRVARRWVIMTCEWRFVSAIEEGGLPLIRFGVWVKPNGAPQFTGDRPATGWEAVAILHGPGKKRWAGGGNHAVWVYNKINGEHPTQKPIGLINHWLLDFTDESDIILDPFAGVGTTCVAAKQMGRRYIGIEIAPEYAAIAQRRVDSVGHQKELFT